MNRYSTTSIIQQQGRKRRLSSTIFNPLAPNTSDIIIRVTSPERLDKLAYDFYKNATMWPVIAVANALGKGTLIVPANTKLRIPSPESAQQFINNINRNR